MEGDRFINFPKTGLHGGLVANLSNMGIQCLYPCMLTKYLLSLTGQKKSKYLAFFLNQKYFININ